MWIMELPGVVFFTCSEKCNFYLKSKNTDNLPDSSYSEIVNCWLFLGSKGYKWVYTQADWFNGNFPVNGS